MYGDRASLNVCVDEVQPPDLKDINLIKSVNPDKSSVIRKEFLL